MAFNINDIRDENIRNIVNKYDSNTDGKLDDKECSKLIFDFDKYTTDENRSQMIDEFKKVIIRTAGGNQPDLIAKHMDRADGENEKISADIWNSYAKLYNGKTIKKVISIDNAVSSLEKYGVGKEQYTFENEDDISFLDKYGNKIIKYGAIVCGAGLSAVLAKKGIKIFKNFKEAKAARDLAKREMEARESKYYANSQKAFMSIIDEYNLPIYDWRKDTYKFMQNKYYSQIRECKNNPYPLRQSCTKDISKMASKSTNDITVKHEGGWFYRFPKAYYDDKFAITERLSVNAYPEKEMLEKIDKFLTETGTKAYYKVLDKNDGWQIRHETLIMYFEEKLKPEVEKKLVKILSPHTRKSTEKIMLGEKLAESIYKVKEPTEKEAGALIQRAKDMDFDNVLLSYLTSSEARLYSSSGNVKSSPAIVKSIEMTLDALEKLQ